MPAKYLSRALRSLWPTYRAASSEQSAPPSIEFELPIQVVHDVSRDAVAARSIVGTVVDSITTGGAGVAVFSSLTRENILTANVGIRDALAQAGYASLADIDVWLVGITCSAASSAEAADISRLTAGYSESIVDAGGTVEHPVILYDELQATIISVELTNGGRLQIGSSSANQRVFAFWHRYPVLITPDRTLRSRTVDDGTGIITAQYRFELVITPSGTAAPR